MERYVKKYKESDHTLISNAHKNEWANRTFSKEIKKLKPSDIVWLQDKKSNYQGYYKVNSKNKFETIGSMPQQIPYRILNSAPIFKEQERYVKKFNESDIFLKVGDKIVEDITKLIVNLRAASGDNPDVVISNLRALLRKYSGEALILSDKYIRTNPDVFLPFDKEKYSKAFRKYFD